MKYLLFAGDYQYPKGGVNDFVCASDSVVVLKEIALTLDADWSHIVSADALAAVITHGG